MDAVWMLLIWPLMIFVHSGLTAGAAVSCRNEQGESVDWFILYKLPDHDEGRGLRYLYMDDHTNGWVYGKKLVNDSKSAVGQTLQPFLSYIHKKTVDFGYLLYNDQPPKSFKPAPSSFGHSKGIVMLDRQTGVWLVHSTPELPDVKNNSTSFWPSSGHENAQTFFCGTYTYSTFKDIAVQLQYIHVYSFDYHVPQTFHRDLQCVAQRTCYPRKEPWFKQLPLTSLAGKTFTSFAKYSRFNDDLYSGLLVNYLGDDFFAKSWGKLHRPLPSNCSVAHKVYNVKTMQLPEARPFGIMVDHSKWCVTKGGGQHWTCIADTNREISQMRRGGGAVCTSRLGVWKAFLTVVDTFEDCQ